MASEARALGLRFSPQLPSAFDLVSKVILVSTFLPSYPASIWLTGQSSHVGRDTGQTSRVSGDTGQSPRMAGARAGLAVVFQGSGTGSSIYPSYDRQQLFKSFLLCFSISKTRIVVAPTSLGVGDLHMWGSTCPTLGAAHGSHMCSVSSGDPRIAT